MKISIILTIRTQAAQLGQILPMLSTMSSAEIIVIALNKEMHDLLAATIAHPVKLIPPDTNHELTDAQGRNLGAEAATSKILCFLNMDYYPIADLSQWAFTQVKPGQYYVLESTGNGAQGLLVCMKTDFIEAGGYDLVLADTPLVSIDLYDRLDALRCSRQHLPMYLYAAIAHWNSWRDGDITSSKLSLANFYRTIKGDLRKLQGEEPSFDFRRALMDDLINLYQMADDQQLEEFAVSINAGPFDIDNSSATYTRKIDYVLKRKVLPEIDGMNDGF
jgi:hypothetical protein